METARRYAETTRAELIVVAGADHIGFLDPQTAPGRRAIDEITTRLTRRKGLRQPD